MAYLGNFKYNDHEPTVDDKYGVHFEYKDLCRRLLKVQKERDLDYSPEESYNEVETQRRSKSNLKEIAGISQVAKQKVQEEDLFNNTHYQQNLSTYINMNDSKTMQIPTKNLSAFQQITKKHPDIRIRANKTPLRNQSQTKKKTQSNVYDNVNVQTTFINKPDSQQRSKSTLKGQLNPMKIKLSNIVGNQKTDLTQSYLSKLPKNQSVILTERVQTKNKSPYEQDFLISDRNHLTNQQILSKKSSIKIKKIKNAPTIKRIGNEPLFKSDGNFIL